MARAFIPRSLRARLLVGTTAITAAALVVLGLTIDAAVRHVLLSEFDAAMLAKAKSLASMVEQHNKRVNFEFEPDRMPEFGTAQNPEYFEIWLEDQPFARSLSLGTADFCPPPAPDAAGSNWTMLPDGRGGRVLSLVFTPYVDSQEKRAGPRPKASLVVARDTRALDHTRSRLRWAAFALAALAVSLSGAALVLLVHFATRPVRGLAARIGGIGESDLNIRLDKGDLPSELAPVVDRLNELLGRLSVAMERERGFTADAAHELRTPLAGLRATLEVCRARPRDAGGYETAIDKSLDQLGRLQSLVENLLMLARADAGQASVEKTEVDLRGLIDEAWLPFVGRAAEKGLRVKTEVAEGAAASCDPQFLRVVLANLFDNAVSHSDRGGEVGVEGGLRGDGVAVEIMNTGSRVTPVEVSRVFERFWRGDESRAHSGRHAGLGLGLCRRLLSLTGGSIEATSEGGRFRVTVTLPAVFRRDTGVSPVQGALELRKIAVP